MENIYFQQSYATVGFDKQTQAVCVQHHGPQTSREFRLTIKKGVECWKAHLKEGIVLRWLADTRKHGALSPDDLAWCSELLRNECRQMHKMAFVTPQNLFGNQSIQQLAKLNRSRGISNQLFATVEKAKSWLLD